MKSLKPYQVVTNYLINTVPKSEIYEYFKVYYIDYGTVTTIWAIHLYFLNKKFGKLPQQAVRARLMGIYPPVRHMQWSLRASDRFVELVKCKTLIGQVAKINAEVSVYTTTKKS